MLALQLNPPFYVETEKGPGWAVIWVWNGLESSMYWVVISENGQIWNCPNEAVRGAKNWSAYRPQPEKP